MKKILLLSILTLILVACGGAKNTGRIPEAIIGANNSISTKESSSRYGKAIKAQTNIPEIDSEETTSTEEIKKEIIAYAKSFEGTRYKFGGTTKSGMDCSGLICVAFKKKDIDLPRISRDIATKGIFISFKDIEPGDLVFFKTSRRNTINHVGLVVEAKRGEVKFIHSTTRAGVIISSLSENYWKNAFVQVRRVI